MILQDLWDYIDKLATIKPADTRETLKKWLLKKTYSGVMPEKRRAIPRRWVETAWYKQQGKCGRCRNPVEIEDAVGDHFRPLIKGGKHSQSNIRITCAGCNSSKGGRSPAEDAKYSGQTVKQQIEDSHL